MAAILTRSGMPYYRGKGYGAGFWLLLVCAAGAAVWATRLLLLHAGILG